MKQNIIIIFTSLIFAALLSSCASEQYIDLNQKIRHDDFLYSVADFVKSPLLKDSEYIKKPAGVFYIIKVKIENEAKSVAHHWDNELAYVVDGTGKMYENDKESQKLYYKSNLMEYKESYTLQAGQSLVTVFIFDVPDTVKDPCLKFRGDFLMGDLFDGGKFTKTKIKLF